MKFLLAVTCVFAAAAAAPAENVKTVAAGVYAVVDHGFEKRDIKGINSALRVRVTPDFKAVAGGQTLNYRQLVANFSTLFRDFSKVTSSKSTVVSCKVVGKTGTLRVSATLVGLAGGKDGKPHKVVLTNVSEDIWKNVGGTWKWSLSTTLNQTVRVDGKLQSRPSKG